MFQVARQLGERRVQANALTDLASLDLLEGDLVSARERLTTARHQYRELGYALGEVNARTQLAEVYSATGDHPAALAVADSAAQAAARHGFPDRESDALTVLADVLADLGSDLQALRLLDSAARIDSALDRSIERGGNLRRRAAILERLGRSEAAIGAAREALQLHEAAGVGPQRLADLLLLATIDPRRADEWLARARKLADSLGAAWATLDVALATTRLELEREDHAGALRTLEVLGPEPRSEDPSEEWQIADLRAEAYRGLGRLADAETAARAAVRAQEMVRRGVAPDWARARLLRAEIATRNRLLEVLLARGDVEGAFAVADGANAFTGLARSLGARAGATPPPEEQQVRRIAGLVRRLRAEELEDGPNGDALRRRLAEARDAYERVLAAAAPAAGSGEGLTDAGPVRAALRDDEALLSYFIGPERVHLFIATRESVRHTPLAVTSDDLARRARLARDLLARPETGRAAGAVLRHLHELLLGPVDSPGGRWPGRVILVAPGDLAHLPFGALLDPRTGRYLVEETELVTAPSAAALAWLRQRPERQRSAERLAAFAPDPDDLPWSAIETRQVVALVPRAVAYVGGQATERGFRTAAGRVDILHVSAHAALNRDNPLFSWIALRGTGSSRQRVRRGRRQQRCPARRDRGAALGPVDQCQDKPGAVPWQHPRARHQRRRRCRGPVRRRRPVLQA
jgi:CHAT domain-containing protein